MGTPRGPSPFVRRLEDQIAAEVARHDRLTLAYSGGLACTVLAMIARKRCELRCVVAGVDGSPDFRAAKLAKDHLDYRVEYVHLDAPSARGIFEQVAKAHAELSPRKLAALVPLLAVLQRTPGQRPVSGFGSPRLDDEMIAALGRLKVRSPLLTLSRGRTLPRKVLQEAAVSLGLPREWTRLAHRSPAAGAGIEPFLREAPDVR